MEKGKGVSRSFKGESGGLIFLGVGALGLVRSRSRLDGLGRDDLPRELVLRQEAGGSTSLVSWVTRESHRQGQGLSHVAVEQPTKALGEGVS